MDCLKVIHGAVDGLSHSIHTEALTTAPMLHLVIAIVQHSFEITSDPDCLPNILRKLFIKKDVKGTPLRLRRGDRDGALPALSSVMSVIGQTDTPSWVRTALLTQLHRVQHPIKLSACAALLRELVEADLKTITSDESALLSALLRGYTPRAAALLGACPEAVSVFVDVLRGERMKGTLYQLQAVQQVSPELKGLSVTLCHVLSLGASCHCMTCIVCMSVVLSGYMTLYFVCPPYPLWGAKQVKITFRI